jgi:hypothetical protein
MFVIQMVRVKKCNINYYCNHSFCYGLFKFFLRKQFTLLLNRKQDSHRINKQKKASLVYEACGERQEQNHREKEIRIKVT